MWDMLAGGAMSLLGTHMTNESNERNVREANAASGNIATQQMAFQERMSNTAYQRAVKDLRDAGLNPMLAYQQGGASTPPGSSFTAQAARAENAIGAGVSSALEAGRLSKDIGQADAGIELAKAQAATQQSASVLNQASATAQLANTARTDQETLKAMRENNIGGAAEKDLKEASRINADTARKTAVIDNKTATFDAYSSKVRQGLGLVNDAVDLVKPKLKINNAPANSAPAYDRYDPKTWRYKDRLRD